MKIIWTLVLLYIIMIGTVYADVVVITPEFIEQMEYKIAHPMPCNFDSKKADVFGYYGTDEDVKEKKPLFQNKLDVANRETFGLYYNMRFTEDMMEYNGMKLRRVEVDYKPLNKRCTSGFGGPGFITK